MDKKKLSKTNLSIIDVCGQNVPHPVGFADILAVHEKGQLVGLLVVHPPKVLSVRDIVIARIDIAEHGSEPRSPRYILLGPYTYGKNGKCQMYTKFNSCTFLIFTKIFSDNLKVIIILALCIFVC